MASRTRSLRRPSVVLLGAIACIQACSGNNNSGKTPAGGFGGATTQASGVGGASSIVGSGGVGGTVSLGVGGASTIGAGGGSAAAGSSGKSEDSVIASASEIESWCQTICDQNARCGGVGGADCLAKCHRLLAYSHVSQQALDISEACYSDPACLDSDTCDALVIERDPSITPMLKQCYQYINSCQVYRDPAYCEDAVLMVSDTRGQVEACTKGSCGDSPDLSCFSF